MFVAVHKRAIERRSFMHIGAKGISLLLQRQAPLSVDLFACAGTIRTMYVFHRIFCLFLKMDLVFRRIFCLLLKIELICSHLLHF